MLKEVIVTNFTVKQHDRQADRQTRNRKQCQAAEKPTACHTHTIAAIACYDVIRYIKLFQQLTQVS